MNSSQLKFIALFTMLIDHIGIVFFPEITAFRIIGRISFPLFAWLIAQGAHYTRDIVKYLSRLIILAFISQIPFGLLFFGKIYEFYNLNVIFTFILALLAITVIKINRNSFLTVATIFVIFLIFQLFNIEYGLGGFLIVIAFYFLQNKPRLFTISFVVITICLFILPSIVNGCFDFNCYLQLYSVLALPILYFYNKKKGRMNSYLLYAFYPVHLIILFLVNYHFSY